MHRIEEIQQRKQKQSWLANMTSSHLISPPPSSSSSSSSSAAAAAAAAAALSVVCVYFASVVMRAQHISKNSSIWCGLPALDGGALLSLLAGSESATSNVAAASDMHTVNIIWHPKITASKAIKVAKKSPWNIGFSPQIRFLPQYHRVKHHDTSGQKSVTCLCLSK